MPNYSILHDYYLGKGPYKLDQLKEMADLGELELGQEVKRSDMKKSVTLDYALIFLEEDAEHPQKITTHSWFKFIIGMVLCLIGISLCAALIKLLLSDSSVGMRQVFLAVIFTITGGKMVFSNSPVISRKHK